MAFKTHLDTALAPGSLILVTGATGYIAANVVKEALAAGYRVRGTVRSLEKAATISKVFNSLDFEAVIVPALEADEAFKDAVKGVDGIIHLAMPDANPDPKQMVGPAVNGAIGIMDEALKEPSVKRYVFTSSSIAASMPMPGQRFKIDKNSWNDMVEQFADFPPPYTPEKMFMAYAASKLMSEKAVWKFVQEKKPHFAVNCILPNFNIGRLLAQPSFTAATILSAYKGDVNWDLPPQYMIDVIDDARIHIAALVDASVANERIFAYAEPYNWNDILDVFRELRPGKTFVENRELPRDLSEVDNVLAKELLSKWWGQEEFTGLKESIRQHIEGLD